MEHFDLALLPVDLAAILVNCLCNHRASDFVKQLLQRNSFNAFSAPKIVEILRDFKAADTVEVVIAFEKAVSQHPYDEKLWLDYIAFEMNRGNISSSSSLFIRASGLINNDHFSQQYEKLVANLE
jgi:DNA-binding SARP family transcriptional activator